MGGFLVGANFNCNLSEVGCCVLDRIRTVENLEVLLEIHKGLICCPLFSLVLGWYGLLFGFYKLSDLLGRELD